MTRSIKHVFTRVFISCQIGWATQWRTAEVNATGEPEPWQTQERYIRCEDTKEKGSISSSQGTEKAY